MDSVLLWQIGYGVLGGMLTYLVFHGILVVRLFRLQMNVAALRESLLSISNREKVNKRWDSRAELERDISRLPRNPVPETRYANDPMSFG